MPPYEYTFVNTAPELLRRAENAILEKYSAEVTAEFERISRLTRMQDVARMYLDVAPGKIMMCIRLVRTAFGLGLAEAKAVVDSVR
jgi:ribosomal protein L7/L12